MPKDIAQSGKDLAYLADLLDSEARKVFDICVPIQMKWQHRANTVSNLDMMRDEILTTLAEIGILAQVDPAPCLYGEPPVVEIIGYVGGVKPTDHEQKKFEVLKAKTRNEEYLGQKERPNRRKPT